MTQVPRICLPNGDLSRITNGPTSWSLNGLPRNQTVIFLGSQTDQQLGLHHQTGFSTILFPIVQSYYLSVQNYLNVDPWCDLLSSMSVTMDSAIDRLNTLCRGSTLYPHHGTHGLALPFGWTNDIPTEISHCHDTLSATPTYSLPG